MAPVAAHAVDHVIALAPAAQEYRDHLGRMLQVAVHDDDRVAFGGVEAGGDRDLLAVDEHMAERRQPFEPKYPVARLCIEQAADIPGIAGVQRLRIFAVEQSGLFECSRDRTGHRCGDELRCRRNIVRRRIGIRLGQDEVPSFRKQNFLCRDACQPPPHAQLSGVTTARKSKPSWNPMHRQPDQARSATARISCG